MKITTSIVWLLFLGIQFVYSQQPKEQKHQSSAGEHAPIGIMGDHTHHKGEWMVSYRYMYMNMEGLLENSSQISTSKTLESYMVAPTEMQMYGHMIGIMFAPNNKLTLSVMSKYISFEMAHLTRMGNSFTTATSGFGDMKVAGLYRLLQQHKSKLHAEIGISIPTGSIQEKDITPASNGQAVILPYPMQIGSGTWGTSIGLTYLYHLPKVNIGMQGRSLFRYGKNNNGYRLGNTYEISLWSSYDLANWISISAKLQGAIQEKIIGSNPVLNPNMVPTADTNNSGRELLIGGLGLNLMAPKNKLPGVRLGIAFRKPLYQNVQGIQLQTRESFTIGLQYSFQ